MAFSIVELSKRLRSNRSVVSAAGLLLILLLGIKILSFLKSTPLPTDKKVVEVQTANRGTISLTHRLIGTIRAQHSTTLISKERGSFIPLYPAGTAVKKGTLIAKIENPDIEKAWELSKAFEKIAHEQYDRIALLQKTGTSSKSSLEEKKNAWISAQKALTDAKIALDKIYFYAPFEGTLGVFKVREGAQVKEDDPVVSLYDMNSLIIEFDLPADLLPFIHNHQTVFINNEKHKLTHVQRMLDEETHMCPAYLDYKCTQCLIGTPVEVDVLVDQHHDVIILPFDALILQNHQFFVYQVVNGKAVLTAVTVGLRQKDQIEIISGLKGEEQVIIEGQSRLYPDIEVTLHSSQAVSTKDKGR